MLRYIRWAAYGLIFLLVTGWAALWVTDMVPGREAGGLAVPGGVSVGGPFTLVDGQQRTVTDADFRGRLMLVFFGYTFCPDVCPTELQTVAGVLERLGVDAARVAPVFITIDPERDTPAVVGEYVKLFDDRLIGLTGSAAQVAAAAKAYRVYYAKAATKTTTEYLMDHSSFLYLMGTDGKLRALFRPDSTADEITAAIRARLVAGG
jgi:protein SCO1/2